ncbi:MAG: SAM-dependent methyltransferase [Chloroflexota bacterium]
MSITLEQVVPWGRSMDEYCHMFALTHDDLKSKILGCGDGPASFNREMTERGYHVTSIDPIYRFSAKEIEQRVRESYRLVVDPLYNNLQNYVWTRFKDPEELGAHRLATMQHFIEDYEEGRQEGRYQEQSVPHLAFADNAFDLALSSHFLFLYTEQLSYEFHKGAIIELCRVAEEVRIFPLMDLACQRSSYVARLEVDLAEMDYQVDIQKVPYEFQRDGGEMMCIVKRKGDTYDRCNRQL